VKDCAITVFPFFAKINKKNKKIEMQDSRIFWEKKNLEKKVG
jgi:hypothetical protein